MFFYTIIWSSYSRCLGGFFAIFGVLHIRGIMDFSMIINLLMFIDSQVTFIMLSFCYAQRLSYLQRTVFPSTCIFATIYRV
jgi:hypothetical protein